MTEHCKDILYKDIAPAVINNDMLLKAIDEQRPSGEAGRLAREDGIEMNEIVGIRLEFLNILRIDYLWVLTGLTKLSLSNNMIEKIENLDALVNLIELDLSFNQIEVVENLNELINLEVLTLYHNRISFIENMNNLKNLHIFSIGENNIEDRETIFHLRRLKKLRSVNMTDNPCSFQPDFRIFIATFLPQIMYYEYKRISKEERTCGLELFGHLLREVQEGEVKENEELQREEDEKLEAEMHAESFIEFLGGRQLFDSLFDRDPEGKLLLQISDVQDLYAEYEVSFPEVSRKLFEVGQERYHARKIEVQQYDRCVNTAKEENQLKCQEVMEKFLEQKAISVADLKENRAKLDQDNLMSFIVDNEFLQTYVDIFNELIHETWKKLMCLEMNLFDQLEETNLNFERALTELITAFIEEAQGYFVILRGFETTYMESVSEAINKLVSNYQSGDAFVPDDLKPICDDKEVQNNAIAASHDTHLQLIDGREDRLISRAKAWLQNLVTNLQKNEISRNRGKVLEINHFLDCQREELEDLYMQTPELNEDITAALA